MNDLKQHTILIRGAGEMASAVGVVLQRVGFLVILTDLPIPFAIRRTVCFSDAMLNGSAEVEGIQAVKTDFTNYLDIIRNKNIPPNRCMFKSVFFHVGLVVGKTFALHFLKKF